MHGVEMVRKIRASRGHGACTRTGCMNLPIVFYCDIFCELLFDRRAVRGRSVSLAIGSVSTAHAQAKRARPAIRSHRRNVFILCFPSGIPLLFGMLTVLGLVPSTRKKQRKPELFEVKGQCQVHS
jgi:hypothetical protein